MTERGQPVDRLMTPFHDSVMFHWPHEKRMRTEICGFDDGYMDGVIEFRLRGFSAVPQGAPFGGKAFMRDGLLVIRHGFPRKAAMRGPRYVVEAIQAMDPWPVIESWEKHREAKRKMAIARFRLGKFGRP